MKTFKNTNFIKRNYKCTNLVFCQAQDAPDSNWIECDESENNLDHLYTSNGVRYFGWL